MISHKGVNKVLRKRPVDSQRLLCTNCTEIPEFPYDSYDITSRTLKFRTKSAG